MNPGEIVLVRFPFTDLESSKKRPALVLAVSALPKSIMLVTIAMITSKTEGLSLPGDCKLLQWQKEGLLHPSVVRLSKVATLESELIEKVMGKLSAEDSKTVSKSFCKIFSHWLS